MVTCAYCKTQDTELYHSGIPICLTCVNAREANAKEGNGERATAANGHAQLRSAFVPEDLKRSG